MGVLPKLGVDKERGIQGLLFQSVIINDRLYHSSEARRAGQEGFEVGHCGVSFTPTLVV